MYIPIYTVLIERIHSVFHHKFSIASGKRKRTKKKPDINKEKHANRKILFSNRQTHTLRHHSFHLYDARVDQLIGSANLLRASFLLNASADFVPLLR